MGILRVGDDLAQAGYKFKGTYAGVNPSVINSLNSSTLARILSNATQTNPREMAKIFGKMDDANLEKIVKNMKSDDYAKMMQSLDAGGSKGRAMATKMRGLNKGDDVGTAYRQGADAAQNPRGADDVRNIDNTASRKEFWSTVRSGAYIGAGAGLLMWIDKKFEDADEEYKDCMAGCVPENWDEYDSGTLKKSELKYSSLDSLNNRGLAPIDNQPYCKAKIKDCGEFCSDKCEKETEVDLPGDNLFREGPRYLGGLFGDGLGGLFGGLGAGLGLGQGGLGGTVSSGLSAMSFFMIIIMAVMSTQK